jgi:hypothetical protein
MVLQKSKKVKNRNRSKRSPRKNNKLKSKKKSKSVNKSVSKVPLKRWKFTIIFSLKPSYKNLKSTKKIKFINTFLDTTDENETKFSGFVDSENKENILELFNRWKNIIKISVKKVNRWDL